VNWELGIGHDVSCSNSILMKKSRQIDSIFEMGFVMNANENEGELKRI
jgi:hypothetical protein